MLSVGNKRTLVTVATISFLAGLALGTTLPRKGGASQTRHLGRETLANISSPQKLDRRGFEVQYPSNWRIKTEDDNYDPDANIFIESPGEAFAMLIYSGPAMKPSESVDSQVEEFRRLMARPIVTTYQSFGSLTGEGAIVKGKILGIPTTVKIFSTANEDCSLLIVQHYTDSDLRYVGAAFDLIERSFVLKTAAKEKP